MSMWSTIIHINELLQDHKYDKRKWQKVKSDNVQILPNSDSFFIRKLIKWKLWKLRKINYVMDTIRTKRSSLECTWLI